MTLQVIPTSGKRASLRWVSLKFWIYNFRLNHDLWEKDSEKVSIQCLFNATEPSQKTGRHQDFQVPKMGGILTEPYFGLFWEWVFPYYISRIHTVSSVVYRMPPFSGTNEMFGDSKSEAWESWWRTNCSTWTLGSAGFGNRLGRCWVSWCPKVVQDAPQISITMIFSLKHRWLFLGGQLHHVRCFVLQCLIDLLTCLTSQALLVLYSHIHPWIGRFCFILPTIIMGKADWKAQFLVPDSAVIAGWRAMEFIDIHSKEYVTNRLVQPHRS